MVSREWLALTCFLVTVIVACIERSEDPKPSRKGREGVKEKEEEG